MSFLSLQFAIFFPVVCLLFFACPRRWRWMILLPASYLFYMAWQPWYLLLILFTTVVDYGIALLMDRSESILMRRTLLGTSLVTNLGLLFFFKYHNWFARSFNDLFVVQWIPLVDILLPVGISFYTFQTLAYTIEVYYRRQAAEPHFGYFATYIAYFPQLVAGPIERPQNLLPQLWHTADFDYSRMVHGLKLMAWGYFKKAVVADRMATLADPVFSSPTEFPSLIVLATLAFGLQIYCDFSGYSDIAIGAADVMGIRLMKNFRAPYRAVSLQDFWRRWHISLSTWFRDYLYKPWIARWGGTQRVMVQAAFAVFVISGLWHGAAWTFVAWGMLHGVMYSFGRLTADARQRFFEKLFQNRWLLARRYAAIFLTFVLVHIGWVFFRARSIDSAFECFRLALAKGPLLLQPHVVLNDLKTLGWGPLEIGIALYGVCTIFLVHQIQERHDSARGWLARQHWIVRHAGYQLLIWSFILFGVFDHPEFIYFQF